MAIFIISLKICIQKNPIVWSPDLQGLARSSVTLLMRSLECVFAIQIIALIFACKSSLKDAPAELIPWFNLDNPLYKQIPIVFGHWASLVDELLPQGIYALDTGCVWNNRMTLLRWEDKQLFTQSAVKNYGDF